MVPGRFVDDADRPASGANSQIGTWISSVAIPAITAATMMSSRGCTPTQIRAKPANSVATASAVPHRRLRKAKTPKASAKAAVVRPLSIDTPTSYGNDWSVA